MKISAKFKSTEKMAPAWLSADGGFSRGALHTNVSSPNFRPNPFSCAGIWSRGNHIRDRSRKIQQHQFSFQHFTYILKTKCPLNNCAAILTRMTLILTGKAWKKLVLRRQPQPVLVCVARHPNAKRYLVGCRLTSTPLPRKSKRTTWIFR